ncbi:MAG: TetR family transcriptional regulator C-terminal domain-containing protein [Sphaerochaetaceae bacterium]|nr:TetR family transcriptional regulator C-terminal domain-containing protein [Sphaerochaetaceae bacterium]
MNTINNARSRNTERLLEETYLYLLSKHPKRPVNVVEICTKAKVNRATFYAHYTDILNLQEKIEQRMAKEIKDLLIDPALGESIMTEKRMTVILESIKKNKSFYDAWYRSGRNESPSMINRFIKAESNKYGKYHVLYCKAGINALIKNWLNDNCEAECAEMASIIISLST